MTQYIEKVSIELNLDSTKALKQLDTIRSSFEKLNSQSKKTGETMKKALEDGTKNADRQANKLTNSFFLAFQKIGKAFDEFYEKLGGDKTWNKMKDRFSMLYSQAEKIGDLFGNIFQKFAGYSSFGGLIDRYTMGVLEQEWYNKTLARRTASNSRSNGIYDFLKEGTNPYSNILLAPQTVKNNGVELRKNEYDKEILNQTNYLPGTRRWRISKFPMPFTEEDTATVENYLESLAKVKYQFGVITGEIAKEVMPKLARALEVFADLIKNSETFRNVLKGGFFIAGMGKIASTLKIFKDVLGIFARPQLALALTALGGVVAGTKWGYGKIKNFFENRKKNKSDTLPAIENYKYTPIPQKLLQNATSYNNSKSVSYNIENLNVRSEAKNVNSLLSDVRKNINRDYVFAMNNANYGVF